MRGDATEIDVGTGGASEPDDRAATGRPNAIRKAGSERTRHMDRKVSKRIEAGSAHGIKAVDQPCWPFPSGAAAIPGREQPNIHPGNLLEQSCQRMHPR
jgi:hypothetical protein